MPYRAVIDEKIPRKPLELGPKAFPGFGAVLRYRELGTPREAYLTFLAGGFMMDHTNTDQLAFEWYEKGVPLTLYKGDMYNPMAVTALSHNTIAWDVRPQGANCPGKGEKGCWYHEHDVPWVQHEKRPRLHRQIAIDKEDQSYADTRGKLTRAAELPEAALLGGRVGIHALQQVPTRSNYSKALQSHQKGPQQTLEEPFAWTRRLLYVKADKPSGLNYLVVRDDFGGFERYAPSFSYWSLSEKVTTKGAAARFRGQLGVDTRLRILEPADVDWTTDRFTHKQAEKMVKRLHRKRHGEKFRETQLLARAEGEAGEGFLAVVAPHQREAAAPVIEPWLGGAGAVVRRGDAVHRVVLATEPRAVESGPLTARAAALVWKTHASGRVTVSLPAGGEVSYKGHTCRPDGPAALVVRDGEVRRVEGRDLLREAHQRVKEAASRSPATRETGDAE